MTTSKVRGHFGVFKDDETGLYGFTVDLPRGVDGKRRQKRRQGYSSIRDAEAARADERGKVRRGQAVAPSRLTVAAYVIGIWLPLVAQRVRATTLDAYERNCRNHIAGGELGPVRLQQLNRATVAAWVTTLSESGLSPKTVRNIVGALTSALDDALELGLVPTNVALKLRNLPRAASPKPRAWTMPQTQRFIAHVRDDYWRGLWRFLAMTGCRRGEALGLMWDDVDLEAGTATIRQQRTIAGGSVVTGPPKTGAGFRTVALDAAMVAELRAVRARQLTDRMAMGAGWRGTGLVFCWPDGTAPWPQRVTEWFGRHCDELGLPRVGVHGLRHGAATWAIARGESAKLVQQRLGHSHVSTTLALYSHVQPGHDQALADALGAALDGGSPSRM
jgi:integrase